MPSQPTNSSPDHHLATMSSGLDSLEDASRIVLGSQLSSPPGTKSCNWQASWSADENDSSDHDSEHEEEELEEYKQGEDEDDDEDDDEDGDEENDDGDCWGSKVEEKFSISSGTYKFYLIKYSNNFLVFS